MEKRWFASIAIGIGVSAIACSGGKGTPSPLEGAAQLSPITVESAFFEMATAPLSARNHAVGVWTGSEVIVFGGTETPLCPVCDFVEPPSYLADGAALNLATNTWRPIADLPPGAIGAGRAVALNGNVFLHAFGAIESSLWSYDLDTDQWSEVPKAPRVPAAFHVDVHNTSLLVGSMSDEQGESPDYLYEPATQTWTELPDDPSEASYGRRLLSFGDTIVLFSQPIAGVIDSAEPTVVTAARLDDGAATWTPLATSSQLSAPDYRDANLALNLARGGADGGQVNGWGRTVPYGGWFDNATNNWGRLPGGVTDDTGDTGGGVVGTATAHFASVSGSVLDLAHGTWHEIPPLPAGLGAGFGHTVVAAGTDLFVFGGSDAKAQLTNASWTLRISR